MQTWGDARVRKASGGMGHDGASMVYAQMSDGSIYHVAEFKKSKVAKSQLFRQRNEATCPVCRTKVKIILEGTRASHMAHKSAVACKYQLNPESALHLNTKFYLRDVFKNTARSGATFRIKTFCAGYERTRLDGRKQYQTCNHQKNRRRNYVEVVLLKDWDDAASEVNSPSIDLLGKKRWMDVGVEQKGELVMIIEVEKTHPVPPDKAAQLIQYGVPWIEVEANESLIDEVNGWSIQKPLYVKRMFPENTDSCTRCSAAKLATTTASVEFLILQATTGQTKYCKKIEEAKIAELKLSKTNIGSSLSRMQSFIKNASAIYGDPQAALKNLKLDSIDKQIAHLSHKPEVYGKLLSKPLLFLVPNRREARYSAQRLATQVEQYYKDQQIWFEAKKNICLRMLDSGCRFSFQSSFGKRRRSWPDWRVKQSVFSTGKKCWSRLTLCWTEEPELPEEAWPEAGGPDGGQTVHRA